MSDFGLSQSTPLPALREDLKLLSGGESRDGTLNWLIYDPARNKYFSLHYSGYKMLSLWSKVATATELIELMHNTSLIKANENLVKQMIDFLYVNNLLKAESREFTAGLIKQRKASRQSLWKKVIYHYLFFRIPLVRPDRFLEATYPWIRFIFTRGFLGFVLVCALLGLVLTLRQWEDFWATFLHFFSWQGLALYGLTLLLTKTIHELGHGFVAKHYKCRVTTMGIAFMVMFPLLYTDVTDGWRLKRHRWRLHISMAGMLAELVLATFALLLWNFLDDGPVRSAAFFVATTSLVITIAVNTNPFLRFDGYYILSDATGIPNLQPRAFAFTRWWIRERLFGFGDPAPEPFVPRTQLFLILYALATWLYRAVIFFGIALLVYYLFFKVLGIILFLVEIYWFILKPVLVELHNWWKKRKQMRLNINTVMTFGALSALVAAMVVPWRSTVPLPAHWEAEKSALIFAPEAAILDSTEVTFAQEVTEGEVLFRLHSPPIEHFMSQRAKDIALVKLQISRTGANLEENRKKAELLQYGRELQAEYRAALGLFEQMDITAPFSGEIAQLDELLQVGDWIDPERPLAQLVHLGNGKILAYADEHSLSRIDVGAEATFYPDEWEKQPLTATVSAINSTNLRALPKPYHASLYGGDIAVREEKDQGVLIPEKALYQITLTLDQVPDNYTRVVLGEINIAGEKQALYERFATALLAVLIRESGF